MKKCPKCGGEIGDRWTNGRKLMYYCYDDYCGWKDMPRIPKKKKINDFIDLRIGGFFGWQYRTYDKYGHLAIISQTFSSEAEVMKEVEKSLKWDKENDPAGPYTTVLFNIPYTVKHYGKMFKLKEGKITQTNES